MRGLGHRVEVSGGMGLTDSEIENSLRALDWQGEDFESTLCDLGLDGDIRSIT